MEKNPPLKPSDLWCTPPWLLDLVREVAPIRCDPCPGPKGWTGATREIRLDENRDGLLEGWGHQGSETGLVFVNPPYGRGHLDQWAPKIVMEAIQGNEIIALLPATPGPEWWQDHVGPRLQAVCFLRGRPKFYNPVTKEPEGTGTKDAAVVYFGDRARRFLRVFEGHGWCP